MTGQHLVRIEFCEGCVVCDAEGGCVEVRHWGDGSRTLRCLACGWRDGPIFKDWGDE